MWPTLWCAVIFLQANQAAAAAAAVELQDDVEGEDSDLEGGGVEVPQQQPIARKPPAPRVPRKQQQQVG
jgi:hypothetical protein